MIKLIWAMDQNRLIGSSEKLPWHIKDDLAFFKEVTRNQQVLMGMQTYRSMKSYFKDKPFPYTKVYVLSRQDINLDDATIIHDLKHFIHNLDVDLYVLGGSQIYELMLPYADVLYITYVLGSYVGDTYFPKYDLSNFKCVWYQTKPTIILSKYERMHI